MQAYITSGKTMGIPILYPWANRLSAAKYAIDGGVVTLTPGVAGVRTDEHGDIAVLDAGDVVTSRR